MSPQEYQMIKEEILARVAPLGFCEIDFNSIRWIEEDETVPLNAKVHDILPVIREILDQKGIRGASYYFCRYESDIPTMNIKVFLDDSGINDIGFVLGPIIPL